MALKPSSDSGFDQHPLALRKHPMALSCKIKHSIALISALSVVQKAAPVRPRPISAIRGSIAVPPHGPKVSFESSLERDFLLFCRLDPRIQGVRAQPFELHFTDVTRQVRRHYTPDFLAEVCNDEGGRSLILFEVKRWQDLWRNRRQQCAPFAAARVWAENEKAKFKVVTDRAMSGAWLANARLLSAYLDGSFEEGLEAEARRFFRRYRSVILGDLLRDVARSGLDPNAVLPVLYSLIARREAWVELGFRITMQTRVSFLDHEIRIPTENRSDPPRL